MSGSIASGIFRRLSIARQTAFKTRAPAGSPAKILRRLQTAPNWVIDTISSNEILASQMERTSRAGVGRGNITYAGEFAPSAQTEFLEGILRRQFTTVTPAVGITGLTAASPANTFSRASGSWLTDGLRVGMTVRMTGWTTTGVNNNGRNFRIVALTATLMTVGEPVTAKANETGPVVVTVVGKVNFMPPTGQVVPYFTFEDWQADLATPAGEVYEDARVTSVGINVPSTGMVQFTGQMMARDSVQISGTPHFSAPVASPNTPSLAGVSGTLRLGGVDIATITQVQLQIGTQQQSEPTVGSYRLPDIAVGSVQIRGRATAYLTDMAQFTAARAETEMEMLLHLTTSPAVNADFISIFLPRVKINNPQRADSPISIMQTFEFSALENTVTSGGLEATNVMIQDSTA